jgi:hypothetical protein
MTTQQMNYMQKVKTLKRRIRSIWQKQSIMTYNLNYDILNELICTLSGEKFLLFDSGMEDEFRLIFCADESLLLFLKIQSCGCAMALLRLHLQDLHRFLPFTVKFI